MVGTPQWTRPEGGNHNWVEVYDTASNTWKFTGAAEWGGWDYGWFFPQPAKGQVRHIKPLAQIINQSIKPTSVFSSSLEEIRRRNPWEVLT